MLVRELTRPKSEGGAVPQLGTLEVLPPDAEGMFANTSSARSALGRSKLGKSTSLHRLNERTRGGGCQSHRSPLPHGLSHALALVARSGGPRFHSGARSDPTRGNGANEGFGSGLWAVRVDDAE
jgi:hypothetical protein